ncbi:GAF domain-containing protein [Larsenimonas suaedae]|uniref:GAF domain-containing protein n=1 Tax=Larsenimonas suaedae TaxID=1851019 RepID=A0ABU1GXS1_9GAMM|nr:GAF domain-containing protein [Larsenimonas suaedae]MCM2971578.1 GAF domain-containing protein [Larsenimonas suaedae]MDR5896834.1 GAF domain-containing protein [Larsenimonas suaedae]
MTDTLFDRQLDALLDTRDWVTNTAQMSAFLFNTLSDVNWVGFYLHRTPSVLSLGPFQGKPACNPIPFSKGVCGKAATMRQTQRVDDVHSFPGHIACDEASRAELVVPLVVGDTLWGVLDIDSPRPERFSVDDVELIERLCALFIERTDLI